MALPTGHSTPVQICIGDQAISAAIPLPVALSASASIDIGDVTLLAGTAIAGKFGIDQTTDGTTNLVAAKQSGTWSVAPAAAATGGYSYTHIAAGQATTVVKASAGTLHSVIFNTAATATNVTTIYDHASGIGTVIAIPNAVAATVPNTLLYDLAFGTGLTVITGTANGADMTITWK